MNFFGKTLRKKVIRPTVSKSIKTTEEVVENNNVEEVKETEDMDKAQIAKVEDLVNKAPKKVKVEKKDKGLYERAEVTVVTDDNKMLLKD